MTSQISKTSPPVRISTSERRAAPSLPKSCGPGTFIRLPRAGGIHVDGEPYLARIRDPATQAPSRRTASPAEVSCLLLASDGKTAPHVTARPDALSRQP